MHTRTLTNSKLSDIDVVILCGGMGTRLRAAVDDRPKPMARINERPFLDILIDSFCEFGFRRFVLCVGHMSEIIRDHYSRRTASRQFVISDEHKPLGTAGAVKNAAEFIRSEPFLVTNGDSICPVDLAAFYDFHSARQALMSMVVLDAQNSGDCGSVSLDASQRIIAFEEKGGERRGSHINAGIYLFQKDVLSFIPENVRFSLEYELFPKLVKQACYAFISDGQLIDIGIPKRYELARKCLAERQSQPDTSIGPFREQAACRLVGSARRALNRRVSPRSVP